MFSVRLIAVHFWIATISPMPSLRLPSGLPEHDNR